MSNNYDKIVKLACKPKNAPPKDKYINSLVSATFQDDGALADISRSLSLRLREPNAVIVFKALLTFHLLLRGGSADNLLSYLSSSSVLRLQNVTNQNWEGYSPPSHLGHYARYLDSRIATFRELKHDPVAAQNESNRRSTGLGANSKARRLRHLPVEKGLLREVKAVQRILDSLVACQFYDDDIKDENTVMAYRMLIKDLLVLFQAGNEGVCNILEHYFEMSKIDATEAFSIYKSFIKQTDRIVDYLAIARRLQNVVNVPVPNLKHAPTSLVKALEEYLSDPNFEQNRQEYKKSLGVVEGRPAGKSPAAGSSSLPAASFTSEVPAKKEEPKPQPPPGASQKIQDFFDSIQSDQQPTMFRGPASNNSFSAQQQAQQAQMFQMQQAQFQQQQFLAEQQQQQMANPFRQSLMPQQTGFIQPNATSFPGGQQPFLQPQATSAAAFGNRTSMFVPNGATPFMQPQQTGFIQSGAQQGQQPSGQQQGQQEMLASQPTGFQATFLQPQATGNPFRQSMLAPIHTGVPHPSGAFSQPASPFQQQSTFNRPGSTPADSVKPLTAQPTGSKNPFAPAQSTQPVANKDPSMNELAMNRFNAQFAPQPPQAMSGLPQPGGQGQQASSGSFDPFAPATSGAASNTANGTGTSAMSDIASAFTGSSASSNPLTQFGALNLGAPGVPNFASSSPSLFLQPSATGSLDGRTQSPLQQQPTGFLQPQRTGYGGSTVRPFKPTSNFGAGLLETLPPIQEPDGAAATPTSGSGIGAQPTGAGFPFGAQAGQGAASPNGPGFNANALGGLAGAFGAPSPGANPAASPGLSPQKTGFQPTSSFGQQLVAQTTGAGANPFRQSMLGGLAVAQLGAQPTGAFGAFGGQQQQPQPQMNQGANGAGNAFGAGGAFGALSPFAGQNRPGGSLI
ncbi:hypothetical protein Q5752_004620 [Cryptotrichosporon argae]